MQCSRFRITCGHCSGLDHCCGAGSLPGAGTKAKTTTKKQKTKKQKNNNKKRISCCGSAVTNPTSIREDSGSSPGLAWWVKGSSIAMSSGVGSQGLDLVLLGLWCRLGGYSSDLIPSLGTSICCRGGPKKKTKEKNFIFKKSSRRVVMRKQNV